MVLLTMTSCNKDDDLTPESPNQTAPTVKADATYDVLVLDGDDNPNQFLLKG